MSLEAWRRQRSAHWGAPPRFRRSICSTVSFRPGRRSATKSRSSHNDRGRSEVQIMMKLYEHPPSSNRRRRRGSLTTGPCGGRQKSRTSYPTCDAPPREAWVSLSKRLRAIEGAPVSAPVKPQLSISAPTDWVTTLGHGLNYPHPLRFADRRQRGVIQTVGYEYIDVADVADANGRGSAQL